MPYSLKFWPNQVGSGKTISFCQSVGIKLALQQAAQLSIHFFPGKSVVLHLREGPD